MDYFEDELNLNSLQQGDIIVDCVYIGAVNLMNCITGIDYNQVEKNIVIQNYKKLPAMVISYSCEVAKENGDKITSIILAPIRDAKNVTKNQTEFQKLIDTNNITEETSLSYLKYFYFPSNEKLPEFNVGGVVDFSKCFSYSSKNYDLLLENKVIQLSQDAIKSLGLKVALYFFRQ